MTEQEMPRYQCHKKVRALKIGSIEHKPNPDQSGKTGSSSYGAIIHPDDKKYAAFDVSAEYICKHRPMSGGYYVVYEDGYESYSPAEVFESGYSKLEESSMTSVVDLGKEKKFPITQELYERLESVIHDYDGEISLCEAIGTLELLKQSLIEGAKESST